MNSLDEKRKRLREMIGIEGASNQDLSQWPLEAQFKDQDKGTSKRDLVYEQKRQRKLRVLNESSPFHSEKEPLDVQHSRTTQPTDDPIQRDHEMNRRNQYAEELKQQTLENQPFKQQQDNQFPGILSIGGQEHSPADKRKQYARELDRQIEAKKQSQRPLLPDPEKQYSQAQINEKQQEPSNHISKREKIARYRAELDKQLEEQRKLKELHKQQQGNELNRREQGLVENTLLKQPHTPVEEQTQRKREIKNYLFEPITEPTPQISEALKELEQIKQDKHKAREEMLELREMMLNERERQAQTMLQLFRQQTELAAQPPLKRTPLPQFEKSLTGMSQWVAVPDNHNPARKKWGNNQDVMGTLCGTIEQDPKAPTVDHLNEMETVIQGLKKDQQRWNRPLSGKLGQITRNDFRSQKQKTTKPDNKFNSEQVLKALDEIIKQEGHS